MLKLRWASLLIGLWAAAANAVDVPSLYTAQVTVDRSERDPRARAYEDALTAVLLRVSGVELAGDRDLVESLFPRPASYVMQFRPGPDDTLWVTFDGQSIEDVLQASGQSFWGSDRPLTVLWLAVDWGQGKREIIGADDAESSTDEARSIDRNQLLRERILDLARKRGLPVVFPLLDLADRQQVSFSDIWGGFDEPLLQASQRYQASSVLVGRIRPDSGQRNRWNYYFGGQQRSLTGQPETVLNEIGDMLAAEFSIRGDERLEWVDVRVAGIESVDDYGALTRVLAGINLIDEIKVVEVTGDEVHYQLKSHGGGSRLRSALTFGGLIETQDDDMTLDLSPQADADLRFFFGQ